MKNFKLSFVSYNLSSKRMCLHSSFMRTLADCPPELPPVEIVFIFWDKEAFAVEMSRLVLEELEAVGVLNMEDEVEFRVPLGLSVLPPTGGGRGSLRLFLQENNRISLNTSYD